jgi:hypothetical protein
MKNDLIDKIKAALRKSGSNDTCQIFEEKYPYYGQCAQTSIVIHEIFGGDILKTSGWPKPGGNGNGRHFYNRIDGVRLDFTAEQFSEIPDYTCDLEYQNIVSSVSEAETETSQCQIKALRSALNKALS